MVGELRQVRPGRVAVLCLERVDRLSMESHASGRREAVVERVSDQHVGETQSSSGTRYRADDPCQHRLVEEVEDPCLGTLERRKRCERESSLPSTDASTRISLQA